MNFFKTMLAILYVVIFGYGFLRIFFKDKIPFSIFSFLPASFVAGFGLLAFWGNLIMLARLRLSFWWLVLPFLPLAIYGLSKINYQIEIKSAFAQLKRIKLIEIFLVLVIIFGMGSIFLMSVAFPMHYWDSRAIWGMKAKMLYGDGTIFSSNFLDEYRIQPHFRYPLLYPLAQTFIYFALGEVDDHAVMLLVGLFFPFLVMFLYDLMRIATGEREKALMGAAALSVMPVFFMTDGPAQSGYADTPLALFFIVSFGFLFLWKMSDDFRLLLAGCLFSAFLPLVKNEGILLLLLNLIWIFWPNTIKWERKKLLKIIRNFSLFVIVSMIIIGPWILLRSYIPNVQEEKYAERLTLTTITQNFHRLPVIASFFVRAFLGVQTAMTGAKFLWGGLWVIVVLAFIRAFMKRDSSGIRIFSLLLLFLLLMGGIFIIAPTGSQADLGMTSNFFRVTLPITPLAILLVSLQCDKASFTQEENKIRKKKKGRKI